VTFVRSVDPARLLSGIDASSGSSVKDSYADLDLAPWGFEVLFHASWIRRASASAPDETRLLHWEPIVDDAGLASWEVAWGGDPREPRAFQPTLVARTDVVILAARAAETIVAGAILNSAAGVIGLSNLFVAGVDPAEAFAGAVAAAGRIWPGQDLVGYQAGVSLDAAVRSGFEPIGPLVVWLKP
jgi:hypothetical protein